MFASNRIMKVDASPLANLAVRIVGPFFVRFNIQVTVASLTAMLAIASLAGTFAPVDHSAEPQGCTVRIHADGLRNAKGAVGTLLFTSAVGWPEDVTKAFRHEASAIGSGDRQTTITFLGVPPGDYGVVALHDENRNMKLDRNMFGWPKEGFGFANNPHVGISPPAFREAMVHVTCPVTVTDIHIIYK